MADHIVPDVTVLPPDVLDDATRARLKDAVSRDDPVVDSRRWTRTVFLMMTLVVWFPTMWSGSTAAEVAVREWTGGIVLTLGLYVTMETANRYAAENARGLLRADAIARSIAAAEAFAQQQAKIEADRARAKAEAERRAAERREAEALQAQTRLGEGQEAAAALAGLMKNAQQSAAV